MARITVGVMRITIFGAAEPLLHAKDDADAETVSAQAVTANGNQGRVQWIGRILDPLPDAEVRVTAECIGNDMFANGAADANAAIKIQTALVGEATTVTGRRNVDRCSIGSIGIRQFPVDADCKTAEAEVIADTAAINELFTVEMTEAVIGVGAIGEESILMFDELVVADQTFDTRPEWNLLSESRRRDKGDGTQRTKN